MILNDARISAAGLVFGAEEGQINPASINLRLGRSFLTPARPAYVRRGLFYKREPYVALGDHVEYRRHEGDKYLLRPGKFVLATTLENVSMPANLAAFVQGRSSIGRIGLTTQNAGFVDPGFHGHITLELVNESPFAILLRTGYPVAQLVFFETYRVNTPYEGKYNGQIEATGSRMYMDREARPRIC